MQSLERGGLLRLSNTEGELPLHALERAMNGHIRIPIDGKSVATIS